MAALRSYELPRAFRRFNGSARDELATHAGLVRTLDRRPFFTRADLTWQVTTASPFEGPITDADDALDATLPTIRNLWERKWPGSFHRTLGVIREHTRDTAEGDRAKHLLDEAVRAQREILRKSAYGAVMEERVDEQGRSAGSRTLLPRELVEDYINGYITHRDDPAKLQRLAGWTGFHKMALIFATTELGVFYRRFATGPRAILADPTLHA